MTDEELHHLFAGYGYNPHFVEGDDPRIMRQLMAATLDTVFDEIRGIQANARNNGSTTRPVWPMIVMRTPKGWTGPKVVDGNPVEGTWRSHRVPLSDLSSKPDRIRLLEEWMKSYRPQELFDADGKLILELAELAPSGSQRMGASPHANGGLVLKDLLMPDFRDYRVEVSKPGMTNSEATRALGRFLRDIMKKNEPSRNFQVFGPDETASNRLDALFEVTDKVFMGPTFPIDEHLSANGRVTEILSEHMCQGWLEGYLLAGRHSLFSCYEAFIHIHSHHRRDVQPARQMAQNDATHPVAPPDCLSQLSSDLSCLATGPQRL
jgi:xylulose-5-phosphate/fructose-6-phosphate phosphoketolase